MTPMCFPEGSSIQKLFRNEQLAEDPLIRLLKVNQHLTLQNRLIERKHYSWRQLPLEAYQPRLRLLKLEPVIWQGECVKAHGSGPRRVAPMR